ncbi:hypothetical protein GW864_00035 [bacterium]|nr:hypothetical protein [bacterium]
MFVIGGKKIERKPDNLIKLENMVSNAMQICYQNELKEILEKKVPSLYVDCSNKGDDDIMFFIFKEYIKQSKAKNKVDIVTHAI